MPSTPLTQTQIAERLRAENLDEWQELWWASQGPSKRDCLELIAAAIPFPADEPLRVLDLCCGPGDVGRLIRSQFPKARIDCVDRDLFLLSLCIALNRRENIQGQTLVRDMWDKRWQDGLPNDYDVVATAAALHWFDVRRLGEIFIDVLQVLRPGGVFLFAEPVCAQPAFSAAFEAWKTRQPNVRDSQTWERFWSRANALLGYDHTQFLGSRDPALIGDRGIPVLDYVRMLERAGFVSIDVILRDAETVAIASSKP